MTSLLASLSTDMNLGFWYEIYVWNTTRVFEPFYRLERSRNRDTGGTGLGLSIARNIAHAHGGELTLRNRSAGGPEAVLQFLC